jgi:GTP-binding protein
MKPTVSIVGRPNVGKSTFFNRLVGERKAIVHDSSGVTRDRHYGESHWNGIEFNVIDTGGYVPDQSGQIMDGIKDQVHLAIDESDVILFIVDTEVGITDLDREVGRMLMKEEKEIIVVANKADNQTRVLESAEFYGLGFEHVFAVSAINGSGTGELLDLVVEKLPKITDDPEEYLPKLAIIGRPNVGKSSLVNALTNDERSIVSDIAGTTRDSINTILTFEDKDYVLIDTAGLRRKTRISESVEFYSTIRTQKAVRECDVCLMMIDATQGLEAQDIKVLREAEKFNKGIVLLINKWDLIEKENNTFRDYCDAIYYKIPSMKFVPIISVSATNKTRIFNIINKVDDVLIERDKKISTSHLNKFLERITKERPLPYKYGRQLSIKYMTQVKQKPPVFAFFMNNPQDLPANYRKYIEAKLRNEFTFEGVPVTMVFKDK